MKKSDIISRLGQNFTHVAEHTVFEVVNTIVNAMVNALVKGDRIELRGFGSFSVRYRKPRIAHNPKTGNKIMTMPKFLPHFKPGKELRELVNSSGIKRTPIVADESGDDED